MSSDFKKPFEAFLEERFPPDAKRSTSGVIRASFGNTICKALKDPATVMDKNLRGVLKKYGFQLLDLPSLGVENVLVVPVKDRAENVEDNTIMGKCKKVVFVEDFFDAITEVHEKELFHAGYRKTYEKVTSLYYGILRSVVNKYTTMCPTCQLRHPQITRPPLQPIVACGFLSRLQIDLIDVRHLPDGAYKWILHCVDHWSKFNFTFALESKHAVCVSTALNQYLFPYFGVSRILHSDNGWEFINKIIEELLKSWHSDIQLVSGRPCHPQGQGLVERAHYTLQRKLSAEIHRVCAKSPQWSQWLPRITYAMNIQVHDV